jgi:hypothetical protein
MVPAHVIARSDAPSGLIGAVGDSDAAGGVGIGPS